VSDIANNDRDERGLFRRGNTVSRNNGGGNPNVKCMAELKKALIACATEEDIQSLYKTLLAAALAGDVQAATLLLDHVVGRPSQNVEISGPEGDPVKFDLRAFTATIATALADHPEAQIKLAAALNGVNTDG
jgi:hypothetical protein